MMMARAGPNWDAMRASPEDRALDLVADEWGQR